MEFIDLNRQYDRIEHEIKAGFDRVLKNKSFISGPEVLELEEKLAQYTGRKHAIACSSGTDALVIPLMCYDLKPTDAVFVPSFTFFATAESVSLAGGTPVFIDSYEDTYNMDAERLEEAIIRVKNEGRLTPKGIISVDIFGLLADYSKIEVIAKKYGLFLIEDAAQSFGATFNGKKACSFGDIAATSFFPAKPLGCYGDGGAIFTDDDDLAAKMKSIRVHGQGDDKYDNIRIGMNGRLDTLQAVVLLSKLKIFDEELARRDEAANKYKGLLSNHFIVPTISKDYFSAWAQYTLVAKDEQERIKIISSMKEKGIPVMIYYAVPLHLQKAYSYLGYKAGDLPVCEALCKKVFSIPMHPYLTDDEIQRVTSNLINLTNM